MEIYVITKSIDQLKQLQFNSQGFNSKAYKCYMAKELIRSWFDYGKQYLFQYEVFIDDESKPIEINGTIFDNKIVFYRNTGSALAYGTLQEITLNGKTSKGEVFESKLRWYNKYGENLNEPTTIIYCMVLISLFGPEKINWLFNKCYGQIKLEYESLGDLISSIEEITSLFSIAKKTYDFLGLFHQECMKHILEITKDKLTEFKILK